MVCYGDIVISMGFNGLRSQFFTPWNHHVLDVFDFGALGAVHCRPGKAWRAAPSSSRWNCVTRNSSQKPMVVFFRICVWCLKKFWRSLRKLEACELQKSCCWKYFTDPQAIRMDVTLGNPAEDDSRKTHGFPMISPRKSSTKSGKKSHLSAGSKSPAALQHAHARHGKIG